MKRVKIIGLTGQSGAGKSTAAQVFEQNGFAVINADSLVTRVYGQNKYCLDAVAARFGSDIINSDGTLNRKLLAKRAFSSEENTRALGGIVHPFVLSEFLKELKGVNGYAVFDAPQLFESGIDVICDTVVSVVAEENTRLARIMNRDGITEDEARQRINAQFSEEFFRANSDYIIENNTDGGLEQKTLELIAVIKSR
ncbi:MAG: dephospho-CoA kinase [Oscillospiraceae bacterium]|nr:dephospho-CoA kinase [Oscillospiraceae bacterium]